MFLISAFQSEFGVAFEQVRFHHRLNGSWYMTAETPKIGDSLRLAYPWDLDEQQGGVLCATKNPSSNTSCVCFMTHCFECDEVCLQCITPDFGGMQPWSKVGCDDLSEAGGGQIMCLPHIHTDGTIGWFY